MTPDAFLRSEAARAALARAGVATGLGWAVHALDQGDDAGQGADPGQGEETTVLSAGQPCAVCAYVSSQLGGRAACTQSRQQAARRALRQQRALGFVCHMGLACVTAPALARHPATLTLGPFVPREAPHGLPADVAAGLAALLGEPPDPMPVALDDVPQVAADAPLAALAWMQATLAEHYAAAQAAGDHHASAQSEEAWLAVPGRRTVRSRMRADVLPAREIAVALAEGQTTQAGRWLRQTLAEAAAGPRRTAVTRQRGRALALAGAIYEAAGAPDTLHGRWTQLVEALGAAPDEAALTRALREWWRPITSAARGPARTNTRDETTGHTRSAGAAVPPGLTAYLRAHLADGVRLRDAAAHVGLKPNTLTQRLRRGYGLTFSEYVGRLRVEEAQALLRRTRLPAVAIGRRVGIRDGSAFARLFRRHTGMSPGAWRARYGSKE